MVHLTWWRRGLELVRGIAELAWASRVDSSHTKFILLALDQVRPSELRDRHFMWGDLLPLGGALLSLLHYVALQKEYIIMRLLHIDIKCCTIDMVAIP